MNAISKSRKEWVLMWLPILISVGSLIFTGVSLHRESAKSEMETWNSLRHEFDREMAKERRACGLAFEQGKLGDEYTPVMDYFETVAFLVHSGRMHKDLFDETWGYYFWGYFKATKPLMDRDRLRNPDFYDDVYYMAAHLDPEPSLATPKDLKNFFRDEKNLPD